ncbi:hypothetical protein SCLCIDRAFT_550611 [Scleroderma citrinum Foug A]|uniref:Uncharacterized protein n=1 Tax=Scleroderma citrinum Foug A TaxID=1036808 RepID=A0A0C3D824_9AGAM|nr:hypothetical protein SCLCIDRAFT_550611 [Scleroderma citrinum Foug A]
MPNTAPLGTVMATVRSSSSRLSLHDFFPAFATALSDDGTAYLASTGALLCNPQQMQKRTLDAPMPNLNDLSKGVPLSSVPGSWPLYIIEFKAGPTNLFYLYRPHL